MTMPGGIRASVDRFDPPATLRGWAVKQRNGAVAAEAEARDAGRTLLLLDAESRSAGDRLYRRHGWTEIGRAPAHALKPDGRLTGTTLFYKTLAP
jgi:hypothetical protein